jgi:hypothetical protein
VTHRSDAGEITLGRLIGLGGVVFFACLLFLFVDVKHRMAGYEAVNGQGILGTASVMKCEKQPLGSKCTGDFVSSDGKIQRHDVRINGAHAGDTEVSAAITGAGSNEAWTTDGSPWLTPSIVLLGALIPVVGVAAMIWTLIVGGPTAWRMQGEVVRSRYARDRASAHEREVRMGRVH